MSDQIRKLYNNFKFSGEIAEVEKAEIKTDKNGKTFYSFRAVLQNGPSPVETVTVNGMIYQLNKKNEENRNYTEAIRLINEGNSKVKNANPIKVSVSGAVNTNDYVNEKNELVEGITYRVAFVSVYDESRLEESEIQQSNEVNVEGFINKISHETRGEDREETGRLRVDLVTTDFTGKAVILKGLIVNAEDAVSFEDYYRPSSSASFAIRRIPHIGETKTEKGFGETRVTKGRSYVENIIKSGSKPYEAGDDKKYIKPETIKILLSERESNLAELLAQGYMGTKKTTSASAGGFSSASNAYSASKPTAGSEDATGDVDDDTIPF